MKGKLDIWEADEYHNFSHKGSLDKDHPGMKALFSFARCASKILDYGCGEGTRLGLLYVKGKSLYGVDVSKYAIAKAKKKYPKITFINGDIGSSGIGKDFDLIYSAFVLEHTRNTEVIIDGLINKLKKGGILLLVAPNYGAPNRASPPAKYNRLIKLITGGTDDIVRIFIKRDGLAWRDVEPLSNITYEMDSDTTTEPYLGTLVDLVKANSMKIKRSDTLWECELKDAKPHQRVFRALGEKGIYPFKYWGPHLLLIAERL